MPIPLRLVAGAAAVWMTAVFIFRGTLDCWAPGAEEEKKEEEEEEEEEEEGADEVDDLEVDGAV